MWGLHVFYALCLDVLELPVYHYCFYPSTLLSCACVRCSLSCSFHTVYYPSMPKLGNNEFGLIGLVTQENKDQFPNT